MPDSPRLALLGQRPSARMNVFTSLEQVQPSIHPTLPPSEQGDRGEGQNQGAVVPPPDPSAGRTQQLRASLRPSHSPHRSTSPPAPVPPPSTVETTQQR